MAVSEFARNIDRRQSSQQQVVSATVLALALMAALTSISCGTSAQAGNGAQSLALSGSLPQGALHQSYNAVLSVNGGASPYQFAIASGTLPPGLTLNPTTGSFSGQPTTPGQYSFEVQVTDSPKPDTGKRSYSVTIGNAGGISVSVSPASVNLAPAATQQFTATVSGTANTAVNWSTSSGSVDVNGLYTAPNSQSTTHATVTATSKADSSAVGTALVTVTPGQGQALEITTAGLPQGQQNEIYQAFFSATGGTQPYSWSVTAGSLPAGIAMSTSGNLTGTPTAIGVSNFTVQVADTSGKKTSGQFGISIVSTTGYDGPAQLPLVTVATSMSETPAPGSIINVKSGGDAQSAINSAQCGQTIQLQAGATFSGPLTLPAKSCDNQHWIVIRSSSPDSALPAEGQRVTPCYAGVASLPGRPAYNCSNPTNALAKVQMATGGDGPFQFADGASFYRLIGLEIMRPTGVKGSAILISFQGTADHIIVDRSWLHGQAQDETRNGVSMKGGTYVAIIGSYLNDFHCISSKGSCTDAHAISAGVTDTQDGPYLIQNNFLEASGEEVMFGGGAATKTPTDITITGNHFWKPWQWMEGNNPFVGGPDGHPFIVKNHMEFKNAVRVLAEANLMENSWGGFTQNGFAILMTPKNQHTKSGKNVCPICQVTDVTIRYTKISHGGGGIVMGTAISGNGDGEGGYALAGARFSIHDVVLDDLSKKYVGGGGVLEMANGWPKNPLNTITVNHVTAFPDPDSHIILVGNAVSNASMYGLVFTNNLMVTGRYPVWNAYGGGKDSCAAGDVPLTSIQNCFTTYTFDTNGMIATPPHFPPSSWPKNNFFPNTPADVQFANYNNGNGGDYQLLPSSPYRNKGSDGKDLGADIVGLNAALAGVE